MNLYEPHEDRATPEQETPFVYPDGDGESQETKRRRDELAAAEAGLHSALLFVLRGGPGDGLVLRFTALARSLGAFKSDAAAARVAGVHRATIKRTIRRMRKYLAQQRKGNFTMSQSGFHE